MRSWMGFSGALVLGLSATACSSSGGGGNPPGLAAVELDEAIVFLELNATDEDLGIHAFFDGDAFGEMTISAPNGTTILSVTNAGTLRQLGSTELFTESAEPEFADLDPADFLALFPEGTYAFRGRTLAGAPLTGEFDLEHLMPSMPVIDTDPDPDLVSAAGTLTVSWTLDPNLPGNGALAGGAAIALFQVVVEQEDPADLEPPLVTSIELPATATQVVIPGAVLVPGREAKVEVLGFGENGNKTAGELGIGVVLP